MSTLEGLPFSSEFVRDQPVLNVIRDAGYDGVQTNSMVGVSEVGLVGCGLAMVAEPGGIDAVARDHAADGFSYTTLILGNGLEDDASADRFADAVLTAIDRYRHPLLIETHRASITQDIRRTVNLIARFPDLRFTADFSHWYVGHELAMGDFAAKLAFMQPLTDRVDVVEGRIGSPNRAQMTLNGVDDDRPFVVHHRAFWSQCFKAQRSRGVQFVFAPQLLPDSIHAGGADWPIAYAPMVRGHDGVWREESDRWQQSLLLCAMAKQCAQQALQ